MRRWRRKRRLRMKKRCRRNRYLEEGKISLMMHQGRSSKDFNTVRIGNVIQVRYSQDFSGQGFNCILASLA